MVYGPETRKLGLTSLSQRNRTITHRYGLDAKGLGLTHLNLSLNLIGGPIYQAGALFSYAGEPEEIIIRVGVSFVSTDQACANAEQEIGTSSFDNIVAQSKALWNEKLKNFEIDIAGTPNNVTEMLYSSLYRANLTPVRINFVYIRGCILTFDSYNRIMPPARLKGCLKIQPHHISIPYIAGTH
jgi:putative alpha-1,2-mannosidase